MESDLHDQGYEHLDDAGIIERVLRQSDNVVEEQIDSDVEDEPEEDANCISHKTTMEMLDRHITWSH